MKYQTVFEITQKGYEWWVPALGLILIVIGVFFLRSRKSSERYRTSFWKYWGWVFAGFAVLWTVTVLTVSCSNYLKYRQAFADGRHQTVEGKVENFVPMPYTGHAKESFTVNGVRFAYSDFELTPGFNNTSSHGGPIREGLQVRIHYIGNTILKLEVMR